MQIILVLVLTLMPISDNLYENQMKSEYWHSYIYEDWFICLYRTTGNCPAMSEVTGVLINERASICHN